MEENIKIICIRCEKEVENKHLNLEENIAYCTNCRSIRKIKKINKEIGEDDDNSSSLNNDKEINTMRNLEITPPKGMTIENNSERLSIQTSLNKTTGAIFSTLALISIVILPFLDSKEQEMIPMFLIMTLFLGYIGAVNLYNSVYIEVKENLIRFYTAPLPYFPEKKHNSKDISQIYVQEVSVKNGYSYNLRIIFTNNKDISVISLTNPEYVIFLELTIEDWLGIEDKKVEGEYK